MTDELLSLRVVLVTKDDEDRDLFRQAAASLRVPVELEYADGAAAALACMTAGSDLVYLDRSLPPTDLVQVVTAARTASARPFTVLLAAPSGDAQPFVTDALAAKPDDLAQARRLIERSIRVRLPSRALIVDDSPTMRSIVRKLLTATRFPLEVSEADEGFAALKRVGEARVDRLPRLQYAGLVRHRDAGRIQAREAAGRRRHHDVGERRIAAGPCARIRRCVPEEAVLSGRHRRGAVPVLRLARAQSETGLSLTAATIPPRIRRCECAR